MSSQHFVRYGTAADQTCMKNCQHCFEGVAINGTILAFISKSISMFVHRDIMTKDFFIDPMTHSFQHSLDKIQNLDGKIRRSIRKLIDIFGEPIKSAVTQRARPVTNSDFTKENISGFIDRVLDFQYDYIAKHIDDEYRDYIEYTKIDKSRKPRFLIAPYFYLRQETVDKWKDVNLRMLTLSMEKKKKFGNLPIYGEMVFHRGLLKNRELLFQLIDQYLIADGLLYWVDGFDETEAPVDELTALKNFVKYYKDKSAGTDRRLMNLYGGYFSELLMTEGLDGVVHGLEYGEMREVVPVGGGIPLSKYYLPALRKRIEANTMLMLLRMLQVDSGEKFRREICNCKVCRQYIGNGDVIENFNNFIRSKPKTIVYHKSGNIRIREISYPERESKLLCLQHYLEAKNSEFRAVKTKPKEKLLGEMDQAYERYKQFFPEGEEIIHLYNWARVLRN